MKCITKVVHKLMNKRQEIKNSFSFLHSFASSTHPCFFFQMIFYPSTTHLIFKNIVKSATTLYHIL
jgi:hypothetical protein